MAVFFVLTAFGTNQSMSATSRYAAGIKNLSFHQVGLPTPPLNKRVIVICAITAIRSCHLLPISGTVQFRNEMNFTLYGSQSCKLV